MTNIGTVSFGTGLAPPSLTGSDSSALPNLSLLAGKPNSKNDPFSTFTEPAKKNGNSPELIVDKNGEFKVDNARAKPQPAGVNSQTRVRDGLKINLGNSTPIPNPQADAIKRAEDGQRIDKAYGTKVIKLPGDPGGRQVNLRARINGTVLIDFPYEYNHGQRVSLNVPGVNTKSTPQQIKQAVQKLCNNNRLVPYVYDSGGRATYNHGDFTATAGASSPQEKYAAQREQYAVWIRDLPPGIKETVGLLCGVWFEAIDKPAIDGVALIDLFQEIAKQVTASPATWKAFIDSSFAGDGGDAPFYRRLLSDRPKGGASDGKTAVAIVLALDRKLGVQLAKLGAALETNPGGVGQKLLKGLKEMVKAEKEDLSPKNTSEISIYLGTVLVKALTVWVPAVKGGVEGTKLLKSIVKNSPELLRAIGKPSFESAVASVKMADARLMALTNKAKTLGGLSAAEKTQQTALASQLKSVAEAAANNNPKGFRDASTALNKTLRNERPGAAGNLKNVSAEEFYQIPHPDGMDFLKKSKFIHEGESHAGWRRHGLGVGDRFFDSYADADAAVARFMAGKPNGEYSIRFFEVDPASANRKKLLVSIEPSEKKNMVTSEVQERQLARVREWGSANNVRVNESRFDHNHPNPYKRKATYSAVPSGVQDAENAGDIQGFLARNTSGPGIKFAIWGQDSKTVVKLELTIKAWPLEEKLRQLENIENRSLFTKLFNDCFDVKMQKFDHNGNKIGPNAKFDVMGAITKEYGDFVVAKDRRDSARVLAAAVASGLFAGFGLYKAKEWADKQGSGR